MQKNKKKIIAAVLAAVLVAGIAAAAVMLRRGHGSIYVYSLQEGICGLTDYVEPGSESGGIVSADRVQTVYLSATQSVKEIKVQEGQSVSKGDVLFTYDTTLSQISLQQKELSVQQLQMDLTAARQELERINGYVPREPELQPAPPTDGLAEHDLTGKDFLSYAGSGDSPLTPRRCWLRSTAGISETVMAELLGSRSVLYVVFQLTEGDAPDGVLQSEHGLRLTAAEDTGGSRALQYSFFDLPAREEDGGYTVAEIARMRAETVKEIRRLTLESGIAAAEYDIMQREADSGIVTAGMDGVVKSVVSPEKAADGSTPLMKISGGGGYYVEGTAGELELDRIRVGQQVTVSAWDTGKKYNGTVQEISPYPAENTEGSSAASQYPYRVSVEENAELQEGSYVTIQLVSDNGSGSVYVDNAFLRRDGAACYVYVRGENGKLEKRPVQVGENLWGSYTRVRSGLDAGDYLAFPYGREVRPGATTREGSWDTLQGGGQNG